MISEIRNKKVLKRIGELLSIGMNPEDIREAIKQEFKIDASKNTISRVIKTYSVKKREIIHQDERFKELYKEIILDLINRIKDNLKALEGTRAIVQNRLNKYLDEGSDKAMVIYIREINSAIRTQNDTIKTMNEVLKRLETETKETKMSAVKSVQLSLETLKELENLGLIEIKPDYYREIKTKEVKNDKKTEDERSQAD
ncbi:MAG: hypothetical protein ACTSU6_06760 [Candidatus Njordarchaeales archaeon]